MTISTKTLKAISKKVSAKFKGKYNVTEIVNVKMAVVTSPPVTVVQPAVIIPTIQPEQEVLPPSVMAYIVDNEPVVDPTSSAVQLINNHRV